MEAPTLNLRDAGAAPEEAAVAPTVSRERRFSIKYVTPEGQSFSGDMVSRVLSGAERREMWRAAAAQAGVTWTQLPPGAQTQILAACVVSRQILSPRPEWFDKWAVEDHHLLLSVYAVCEEHTATFFRIDLLEGEGAAGKSRVEIGQVGDTPSATI